MDHTRNNLSILYKLIGNKNESKIFIRLQMSQYNFQSISIAHMILITI